MDLSINNTIISALAIQGDKIFAATDQGLWLTKDMGCCWENALVSLGDIQPFAVTSVVSLQRQDSGPVVIAGVGGGLLRSEDGGSSWNFIPLPSPAPVVTGLAASAEVVYAATELDGVYLSKDSGKRWVRWNFGLLDWHVYAITVVNGVDGCQAVCIGTETGAFYSINQGRTWLETDFPINAGAVLALSATTGLPGDLVIAATETGQLYRSLDQGKAWARCVDDLVEGEVYPVVLSKDQALAVCQDKLLRSFDGGLHWSVWRGNPAGQPITNLLPAAESACDLKIYAVFADRSIQVMDFLA